MTKKYTPSQELRYQSKMLEQISKNTYVIRMAATIFMVILILQCSLVFLYLAGILSIGSLLFRR